MKAAANLGNVEETRQQVRQLVAGERPRGFVAGVLGRDLGL
jgi:hypothetical protein